MDIVNLVHLWISLNGIMAINNSSSQIINNDCSLCKSRTIRFPITTASGMVTYMYCNRSCLLMLLKVANS